MKFHYRHIIFLLAAGAGMLPAFLSAQQTSALKEQLQRIISGKRADVGIAVILNGKDSITVNNDDHYPMMSVVKFHQALAVTDYMMRNRIPLDSTLFITKEELKPDTYSPLRDKYPDDEVVAVTLSGLLTYTLQQSDNNACDILFNRLVSPKETDRYIHSLGIDGCSISMTEDDMHRDLANCYLNQTTPLAAACLFEKFLTLRLPGNGYHEFLKHTLISCQTGKDRLARPLGNTQAVIGHKTGTGDRNADGKIIGTNDAGFVILPDEQHYTIAVFIKSSAETPETTAQIIADISETVYRYISK